MADNSKIDDPTSSREAAKEVIEESNATSSATAQVESENEDEEEEPVAAGTVASSSAAKKKKSKRKRIKAALTGAAGKSTEASDDPPKMIGAMDQEQIQAFLKMNPGLAQELRAGGKDEAKVAEDFKKLSLEEILSGLASSGKNVKDMAGYKFWQTQPVGKLGDKEKIEKEGPFKEIDIELVRKEPYPMADGFEWVTMDLMNDDELKEVFELLYGHYVEDDEAMFRFNYSKSFLKW